jgi:Ser/Thr protein kinase RdoA (MazF antagonist)
MMTAAIVEAMRAELGAALPRWGLFASATLAFLSHSENTTFLAHDPLSNRQLVLRVHRVGYHSTAEIASEFVMDTCAHRGCRDRDPASHSGWRRDSARLALFERIGAACHMGYSQQV